MKVNKETIFYWGRKITENTAIAVYDQIGRMNKLRADKLAVDSIRKTLTESPLTGRVVISEGEKDKSYYLKPDEDFGDSKNAQFDFIIDPIEGTTNLSQGLSNSLVVLCICDRKTVLPVGPSFYVDKFMGSAKLKGKIKMEWPLEKKLIQTAKILKKNIHELGVFILDKPRHADLIKRLIKLKVRLHVTDSVDVMGGLYVVSSRPGIDVVIGTGGTPEGILLAAIAKSVNLEYYFRYNPQSDEEKSKMLKHGYDLERWWSADEIIKSKEVYFFATGVTHCSFLNQVKKKQSGFQTETLVMSNVDYSVRKVIGSYGF